MTMAYSVLLGVHLGRPFFRQEKGATLPKSFENKLLIARGQRKGEPPAYADQSDGVLPGDSGDAISLKDRKRGVLPQELRGLINEIQIGCQNVCAVARSLGCVADKRSEN
jgi:hypothetical protein